MLNNVTRYSEDDSKCFMDDICLVDFEICCIMSGGHLRLITVAL